MKNNTFTPGPWTISQGVIRSLNSVALATMKEHLPINGIDQYANSKLMAAAPELLEACQAIMKSRDSRLIEIDDPYYKALELCHAAISKAEGN